MEKAINISKKILPYILILAFSLFGTHLVFYNGLNKGDDFYFHLTNILDKYNTVIDGHSFSAISGNLASGLGSGNGIMYSPLSHFTVVIIALVLRVFGASLVTAYKLVIIGSVFLSGVFMYRFAMHFTKNSKTASLIAASVFVLYPYRLFDAFCRIAFAEAFSFIFLPLFFMGLYDITHFDKDIKILSFAEVVLGGSLLYLSHNITAFFAFIFGMIYLLANFPKIIKLLKNKKYVICAGVSVVLLIGIASIALFSQAELLVTELYNVSDSERMWTDYAEVKTRVMEEWQYSGFLNIPYLKGKGVNVSFILTGILMYFISCFVFSIVDKMLEKIELLRKYHLHLIPSLAVMLIIISLISARLESYLACLIFFGIYTFAHIMKKDTPPNENRKEIYKSTLFWFCLASIILILVMMQENKIWRELPDIFLNIQFPWRLWSLVQLFVAILAGIGAYYYVDSKKIIIAFAVFAGFLMLANQPTIEKRILREEEGRWVKDINESSFDTGAAIGFNKEYIPRVFFEDDYKSKYNRSLYIYVKNRIGGTFYAYEDYSLSPVVLDGDGEITVNSAFSPKYDMSVSLRDKTLIQMPLIYYPGYKITAINTQTGEKIKLDGENVDGLIAFTLPSGEYTVTTDFVGSPLRVASKALTTVSVIVTLGAIIYAILIENKKYLIFIKKKSPEEK